MRTTLVAILLLTFLFSPTAAANDGWELVVLGRAQDGGMPHAGCEKSPCNDVRSGALPREKVSCVGVVNRDTGAAYLFDATPDFTDQLYALTGGPAPDGIFLTHGHIGHYTGLMFLGREVMAAKQVPVYGTPRMNEFLRSNGPWSLLVKNEYITLQTLTPDQPVNLKDGLRVTPLSVPHRDEFTDTVGFIIEGPRAKILFIPDIDQWQKWDRDIRALANQADVLLLDGTFGSMDELPGRSMAEVPHPLMPATRELLQGTKATLWFIHVNHSNRELHNATDVVRDGQVFQL
jgi:pyrroloquinoline quinone biosynthesis protein B